MGTSAIRPIVTGVTGPTGPTGPKGPIGPTGIGIGLTGPKGITGNFVSVVSPNQDFISILAGNKLFTIYGTRGPTGYTGTVFGDNISGGLTFFSSSSGYTLTVRGISFIGNLTGEVTGDSILITPLDVVYGVTLTSTAVDGKVLFARTEFLMDSTKISYGKTSGAFSFSNVEGITTNSSQVYVDVRNNIIDVASDSNNVILGITNGGVYKITTPIGLSGFTLDPSLYGDNELISVTLFVEGNGFSQFPSNVYFEDSPYSSNFGCGTNIMNLMTNDKGSNWYATIIERGYGATLCRGFDGVGSCCYSSGQTLTCAEYVTEDWCIKRSGTFNLFTPCSSTCGPTAICCSNGHCVAGVSKEECEYFGGVHYDGIQCDGFEYTSSDDNTLRQCYDPSQAVTSCCLGSTCIPNVTFKICEEYYKGTPFEGNCCDYDCVGGSPMEIQGACCVSSNKTCQILTPAGCSALGGIFFGSGTTCGDVNCCFEQTPRLGACCYPDGTCEENKEENKCFGIFYLNSTCETSCKSNNQIETNQLKFSNYQTFSINIENKNLNVNCGGNPDPCLELGDPNYYATIPLYAPLFPEISSGDQQLESPNVGTDEDFVITPGYEVPFDDPRWQINPFFPDGLPNPEWPGWDSETWPPFDDRWRDFIPFFFPRELFTPPGEFGPGGDDPLDGYTEPIRVPSLHPLDPLRQPPLEPLYILPNGVELFFDGQYWWARKPGGAQNGQDLWWFHPDVPMNPDAIRDFEYWIPFFPGYGIPYYKHPYTREWDTLPFVFEEPYRYPIQLDESGEIPLLIPHRRVTPSDEDSPLLPSGVPDRQWDLDHPEWIPNPNYFEA